MIHADSHGFRGEFHSVPRRGLLVAPRRDVQPWPSFLIHRPARDPARPAARRAGRAPRHRQRRRGLAAAGRRGAATPARVMDGGQRRRTAALHPPSAPVLNWDCTAPPPSPTPGCRMRAAPAASAITQAACCACRPPPVAASRSAGARAANRVRRPCWWTAYSTRAVSSSTDPHRRRAAAQSAGQGPGRAARNRFWHRRDPATGEVAQRHGQRPGLYAVGHPLRGVSWESNAIGEQIAGATATVTALAEQLRSAAETGFFPSAGTGLGRQAVRAA